MKAKLGWILFVSLICGSPGLAQEKNSWVSDWQGWKDTFSSPQLVSVSGLFEGSRSHPFVLNLQTRSLSLASIKKLEETHTGRVFGVYQGGGNAGRSEVISKMSLSVDGRTLEVSERALYGIFNPTLGRPGLTLTMSEIKPALFCLVLPCSEASESYEVAFIFKGNAFYRRQVRYPTNPIDSKRLEEDTVYSK